MNLPLTGVFNDGYIAELYDDFREHIKKAPRQIFVGGAFDSIDTVGGSQNAYLGSGTWGFNTSTGGAEEIVAAPASQGMHAVVQHGVGFNGDKFNVPFTTTLGSLAVNPTAVTADAAADGTGSFNVVVNSSLALAGLKADAFGLSQPKTFTVNAKQDDPSEGQLEDERGGTRARP